MNMDYLNPHERLLELISDLQEESLSEAGREELNALLKTSAEARRVYHEAMDLHARLHLNFAEGGMVAPMPAPERKVRRTASLRRNRISWWQKHAATGLAAAAVLLVTTGLFALWLSSNPTGQPLTQSQKRRHRVIVEQLRELTLEREAVETAKARRLPRPKPAAPTPEEAARVIAELRASEAQEAKEAEEVTRMIDARRRFVMKQLRMFERQRGPLPDNLDVDESDSHDPASSRETLVAETESLEIGRVLAAEPDKAGVLIRQAAEGEPQRLPLTRDLKLLRGDQIETAKGPDVPCTLVRLEGGAKLDLDRATSVKVLGRDNLRFNTGRVYAHIAVPCPEDAYQGDIPPFSLETEAGRLLTHDLRVELSVSSSKELLARVDSGKAHLVNRKGHVVGHRGQELRSRKGTQPRRKEGFSETIWRGSRHLPGLPFGPGCPIVLSSFNSLQESAEHYALGMALRGEIDLKGLQAATYGAPSAQQLRFSNLQHLTQRFQLLAPRRIPTATLGALQILEAPTPKRASRTHVQRSAAARQIIAAAQNATPTRPLVVLCHGTLTDVASAWVMEPGIAGRVVVVGDWYGQGQHLRRDPWASEIVLRHFRCVLIEHKGLPVKPELLERVTDPKWILLRNTETRWLHHGFGLLYHVCHPSARFVVHRCRLVGIDNDLPTLTPDPNGRTWRIQSQVKPSELLSEFDRVFLQMLR